MASYHIVTRPNWLPRLMRDGKACRVCREPILRVPYVSKTKHTRRPHECKFFYHVQCARAVGLLREGRK